MQLALQENESRILAGSLMLRVKVSSGASLCVCESLLYQLLVCATLARGTSLCLGVFMYKMGMMIIASSPVFPISSNGNYLSNCSRQKPACYPGLLHTLNPGALAHTATVLAPVTVTLSLQCRTSLLTDFPASALISASNLNTCS